MVWACWRGWKKVNGRRWPVIDTSWATGPSGSVALTSPIRVSRGGYATVNQSFVRGLEMLRLLWYMTDAVRITNEDLELPFVLKRINTPCVLSFSRATIIVEGRNAARASRWGKSLPSFQTEMGALKVDKTAGNKSGGLRRAAGLDKRAELYLCV